jgi:hypothetical protein
VLAGGIGSPRKHSGLKAYDILRFYTITGDKAVDEIVAKRFLRPPLECHADAGGDIIGLVIRAAEFAIVVGINRKAVVQ